ncbi:hypothetical protein V500_07608 [Pseudogymnoascus sp. VKM F-4518 (FW-2643)]|nr:hypothetical protein V500_07608 [Pseudogymnoascus sp. VKM F-4518 (FW-2643)]
MVNPAHFKETNPNYKKPCISEPSKSATDIWLFLDVGGTTKTSTDVVKNIGNESAKVARDDVLLCSPTVLSFSLDRKLWLEFAVDDIEDIKWQPAALAHLQIPNKKKNAIQALSKAYIRRTSGNGFDDFVVGKGQGLNVLLHGPLGVGKTLTAEVSAGKLGTSAESVEARLPGIFQRASRWKALLLFNEADVYLEQRSPSEIICNAIVCVFLRTLKYYQGIMFLTTNRVAHIDDAIASRIHWDLEELVRKELNGRDIKNLVSIALALAEQDGTQLGKSHLDIAIDASANFESDFRGGGRIENMHNYIYQSEMAKWRLRNLFSRTSPTVANQTHTSSSTSHSAYNPIPSKPTSSTPSAACSPLPSSSLVQQSKTDAFGISRDFLDKAIQGLPCQERETIEKYILTTTDDTDSALRDVLNAAQEKKKLCEDRRWTFTFRGQIVKLRDEADSVVLWLDRFKQVGDIAVNADPIHAGLPWAGIRFLLEAVISESRQMAALLVGLKVTLYTMNRLKAYMDYLRTLPVTRTRTNFETSLTELHTLILQFLARAIQAYQKSTLTRALDAFWKPEEVRNFESECDKIGARVEIEARNCDRTLNALQRQAGNQLKENLHRVLKELEDLRDVKESVSLLSNKIDLAKLPLAKGATFDSHQDEHNAACLENTRVDEQRQIAKWAEDPHSKCIFWLNGMAGTGKSTISRSVAKTCKEKGLLGASFFFKRGESDRGNARRFFTTIAAQLAIRVPRLVPSIVKVIDDDPTISDKVLREQFEKLVLHPLSELVYVPRKTSKLIIVIDALDECEREGDMREILRLLARAKDVRPVCLRVFVTSRPELPIRLGFAEILGTRPDLVLHEIPSATIKHDISTYLRHEFATIRAENLRRNHPYSLSTDWPGDENIQALVEMANPLFIFAATVCRFVADLKGNPKKRLKVILDYQTESQTSKLDGTYLPILDQLLVDQDMAEKETLGREFRELVGAIIILADPLSTVSLASLLGIAKEDVNGRLESLHSVLSIPTDEDASVRLLHLSFRDFLLKLPRRDKSPFGVDERETHRILASKCLELLSTPGCLKENMCDIDGPGTLQTEVDTRLIDGRLPAHVQYACRYWVYHLEESKCSIRDGDQVYVFLHDHLLHWLEAISLMGKISESIAILGILQSLASIGESTALSRFIYDARRFILKNRWIIEMAALQLYSSAIVFAPKTSIVRSIFKNQIPKWIGRLPKVPLTWSLELQKLEGHSDGVRDVAFSHDGQLLASASYDKTVRIWNPATGAELQKLESHSGWVRAVAFSHNGQLLASASDDRTIRLWNPATGAELQKLEGHSGEVTAVAFSHDGQLLASASHDETVRLWNVATGAELQKFQLNILVFTLSFSMDSQCLETNRGRLLLYPSLTSQCPLEPKVTGNIFLNGHWITRNSQNLLWLPYDYRIACSVAQGNVLAIGQSSGQVTFMEFGS